MITFTTLEQIIDKSRVKWLKVFIGYDKNTDMYHESFTVETRDIASLMPILDATLKIDEVYDKCAALEITAERR